MKKTSEGWWDFSDSLLLYRPTFTEEYVHLQEDTSPYAQLVTQPENIFLQTIAEQLCTDLPDHFDFVDLGPGTEHKEQYFFDACKKLGKTFRYIPIDISERYLELASEYAQAQGYEMYPICAPFEECAQLLPQSDAPRFVSLGMTFGNFEPHQMLGVLDGIAGESGSVFVSSQLRERIDLLAVQALYEPNTGMKGFGEKLRLIGIDPEREVHALAADDGIHIWYEVDVVSVKLAELGMKPGDRILVFQSLRYSRESFTQMLNTAGVSYSFYDVNQPFLAALIKF